MKRSPRPLVAMIVVLAVGVVVAVLLRQEGVERVVVRPGQKVTIMVETRLQRTFEHKSYAKQRGLPVVCRLSGWRQQPDGVTAEVVETGHRLHTLWARIQIHAVANATPGTRKRTADFLIDGQGGWPTVTIVVAVRR